MRSLVISTLFLQLLTYCNVGNAIDSSANIKVSATINVSACQMNNGQGINVEFGSVVVNQIANAVVSVPIPIDCSTTGAVVIEMVSPQGTGAQTIPTNISGLSVVLSGTDGKIKNVPLESEKKYNLETDLGLPSKTGTINLEASLKIDSNATITGGDFKASGWLVLGYN